MVRFVPAREFCKTNLQYIKNMKEIELTILDYAMFKKSMDPIFLFLFCVRSFISVLREFNITFIHIQRYSLHICIIAFH